MTPRGPPPPAPPEAPPPMAADVTAWLPSRPPLSPWSSKPTAAPVAVPASAPGGAAVALITPQVGVVCPAATSDGVRSPHEYACCSAAVGATAPGTFCCTALTPYCSSERPRLAYPNDGATCWPNVRT